MLCTCILQSAFHTAVTCSMWDMISHENPKDFPLLAVFPSMLKGHLFTAELKDACQQEADLSGMFNKMCQELLRFMSNTVLCGMKCSSRIGHGQHMLQIHVLAHVNYHREIEWLFKSSCCLAEWASVHKPSLYTKWISVNSYLFFVYSMMTWCD